MAGVAAAVTFDATFWALAVAGTLLAGVSKGGFGSGAAFAGAAILALAVPPGIALAVLLPLLMLIDLAALGPYWRRWHGPSALWLTLGGLPGAGLGAWVFTMLEPGDFRALIGVVCLAFVGYQGARAAGLLRLRRMRFGAAAMFAAGLAAGFTSFVSHAGGPILAVVLLARGLPKTRFQATTVIVFGVVNLAKCALYAALGLFTAETLAAGAALAPVALLGTWAGVRAHRVVPERAFFALTYLLLALTGARLLWVGVT